MCNFVKSSTSVQANREIILEKQEPRVDRYTNKEQEVRVWLDWVLSYILKQAH
jgi:hypothetical protein